MFLNLGLVTCLGFQLYTLEITLYKIGEPTNSVTSIEADFMKGRVMHHWCSPLMKGCERSISSASRLPQRAMQFLMKTARVQVGL